MGFYPTYFYTMKTPTIQSRRSLARAHCIDRIYDAFVAYMVAAIIIVGILVGAYQDYETHVLEIQAGVR